MLPILLLTFALAQSATALCGIRGSNPRQNGFAFYSGSSYGSLAGCSRACSTNNRCEAFGFSSDTCILYAEPLSDLEADPSSDFVFYDIDCPIATSTVRTTLTTSRRTTTTTSSTSIRTTSSSSTRATTTSTSIRTTSTTPTSTSRSTTTSSTTTSPAPSTTCGIRGYDKATPAAYYNSGNPADGNFDSCSGRCKSQPDVCKSFGYSSATCLLYAAPLAGNINQAADSPNIFFDVSCREPAPGTSTTSTTTSNRPTTTSTTLRTSTSTTSTSSSSSSSTPVPTPIPECYTINGCVQDRVCTTLAKRFQQKCNVSFGSTAKVLSTYEYYNNATAEAGTQLPGWVINFCAENCVDGTETRCKASFVRQVVGNPNVECRLYDSGVVAADANGAKDRHQGLILVS